MNQILCNCCGKNIVEEDYLKVKKQWGFFSDKDGEEHSFNLCEACYDALIQKFIIPYDIKEQHEFL